MLVNPPTLSTVTFSDLLSSLQSLAIPARLSLPTTKQGAIMVHIYHNQQEKELIKYDDYLNKRDSSLSLIESACVLVASVVALVLMATAYFDMVKA